MKTNIHFWPYLAQFFLEWDMFQIKVVEEIKEHLCLIRFFFRNLGRSWDSAEIYFQCQCACFLFFAFNYYIWPIVCRDSLDGIATRYGLGGPEIECRWGDIFRTRPDQLWGPQSLLINGYRVYIARIKRPGRGFDRPPTSSAEVKERVQLYLLFSCSPTGLCVCVCVCMCVCARALYFSVISIHSASHIE